MAVRRELGCASGLHPSFRISRTGCAIRPHSRRPLSWNGVSQEETGILQRQTSDRRAAQWKITPLSRNLPGARPNWVRKHYAVSEDLAALNRQVSATRVLHQVDRLSPSFRLARHPGATWTWAPEDIATPPRMAWPVSATGALQRV